MKTVFNSWCITFAGWTIYRAIWRSPHRSSNDGAGGSPFKGFPHSRASHPLVWPTAPSCFPSPLEQLTSFNKVTVGPTFSNVRTVDSLGTHGFSFLLSTSTPIIFPRHATRLVDSSTDHGSHGSQRLQSQSLYIWNYANSVAGNKQVATFLSVVGATLRDLFASTLIASSPISNRSERGTISLP